MKDKETVSQLQLSEFQKKIQEYLSKFEELRGFL